MGLLPSPRRSWSWSAPVNTAALVWTYPTRLIKDGLSSAQGAKSPVWFCLDSPAERRSNRDITVVNSRWLDYRPQRDYPG